MSWQATNGVDLRQHYRLIDAPITRYLLGLGRSFAGLPALPADWSWQASWEENQNAGALPEHRLLLTGRLAIALLLPFSLLLIYLIGRRMCGETGGLLACLLLGSNALVLLHARRAMAEGALTFGLLFALWSFLDGWRKPWLAGLGMALAFNAKHSSLALLPVGLLAVSWAQFPLPGEGRRSLVKKILIHALIYVAVFGLVTLALNPFLWHNPLQAIQTSVAERNTLLQRQLADTIRLAPEKAMLTPGWRTLSLLANLYILPPAFAEVNQYHPYTEEMEARYLALPGQNLFRNMAGGGLMLILTLLGLILGVINLRHAAPDQRRTLALMLAATSLLLLAPIILVPLTWQRYAIPLAPLACLWIAYGLAHLFNMAGAEIRSRKQKGAIRLG
jgi:4-amino-4-deoxy-L-arabinose transferase-like glycosyltransferase